MAANGFGWGTPINFTPVTKAAWFGLPQATAPTFELHDMSRFFLIPLVLMGENLGHVLATGTVTGQNLTQYIGRAFFAGRGLGTMVSGSRGGMGTTTYGEIIGQLKLSKVYSSAVCMVAAFIAMGIGLCPKFGEARGNHAQSNYRRAVDRALRDDRSGRCLHLERRARGFLAQ